MERRSFLGFLAAAPLAAPAIVQSAPIDTDAAYLSSLAEWGKSNALYQEAMSMAGEFVPGQMARLSAPRLPLGSRVTERYVYQSGYPAIDCLRSVSGVYREIMERRRR
jgi:hypothetical protein